MPNHIQNELSFSGDLKTIQKLKEAIRGDLVENCSTPFIDFNKIIPMPEELKITSGSLGSLAQGLLFGKGDCLYLGMERMQSQFNEFSLELRKKAVDLGLKYQDNLERHGFVTWHGWSRKNWGTKWNAYGQEDENNVGEKIYFQTANCAPRPVIKKLSFLFPTVKIVLRYADEDAGYNTGVLNYHKGELVNEYCPLGGSSEAYEIFLELHPDCDYIKKVGDIYVYVQD